MKTNETARNDMLENNFWNVLKIWFFLNAFLNVVLLLIEIKNFQVLYEFKKLL